jgi:hypothetical protein
LDSAKVIDGEGDGVGGGVTVRVIVLDESTVGVDDAVRDTDS